MEEVEGGVGDWGDFACGDEGFVDWGNVRSEDLDNVGEDCGGGVVAIEIPVGVLGEVHWCWFV